MARRKYKFVETYPKRVAIVAMGRTAGSIIPALQSTRYFETFPNEIWGINQTQTWCKLDRLFVMDSAAEYYTNMGSKDNPEEKERYEGLMKWRQSLHSYDRPIFTSVNDSEWPTAVEFPLQKVVDSIGSPIASTYFHNTVMYAIAYAIYIGVERLDLFGMDFDYYNEEHDTIVTLEYARSGVEFWTGIAVGRGIEVKTPPNSGLLGMEIRDRMGFYGYGEHQPSIKLPS